MRKRSALLFLCLIHSAIAQADQELDATKKENTLFTYSGYIDASYNYLVRSNKLTSGSFNRDNDIATNGFSLQQAAVTLETKQERGLGGLLNVIVGRDPNSFSPHGYDPDVFGLQNFSLGIPQAYLQYDYNQYSIRAGEMLTLAGIEMFNYTKDSNFSRSILDDFAQPGVHTGMRGIDRLNDQWSLIAGLNNGWATIKNADHLNTLEGAIQYTLAKKFTFTLNGYCGEQHLTDGGGSGPTGMRNLIDFFGTWYATEKLSLSVNGDYAWQTKAALPDGSIGYAVWQGIAGYVDYWWTEKWGTSVRAEIFDDQDGYRSGIKQNWREVTLTLGYSPIKSLRIFAETRHDFSNVDAFVNRNSWGANNNQQSYALNMLYQFA